MLSFSNRFHGHGSVRYVYSKGQVIRTRFLICKYTENRRRSTPRVAVVISKKVLKSAVARNRLRRRIYECVRLELNKLKNQLDIVFIISSAELASLSPAELTEHIQQVLDQSGLYKTTEN